MAFDENYEKPSFDELRELNREFDQQLHKLRHGSLDQPSDRISFSFRKASLWLLLLLASLAAPFIVLIRVSVFFYSYYQFNGWLALSAGVAASILLLLFYALIITFRFQSKANINKYVRRGIAGLVIAYTVYGLLYYSGMNTKTEAIQSYYRSLHPIIRVALTTTTLADSDLVVTDIQRNPEDYAKMGLPLNKRSLHFVQPNGYVHAVDLRTNQRAEWKNLLAELTFNIAGLETIRHVGTADHLHVYLPLN